MRGLLHLSPRGRGRLASAAQAKRSKSGEGAFRNARTRGNAPSPGFLRSAPLRSESDLSREGRGAASGLRVPEPITRKAYDALTGTGALHRSPAFFPSSRGIWREQRGPKGGARSRAEGAVQEFRRS